MPHRDPVFDPQKCPVPVVPAIPQRQIIQDCDVPGPPDPIFDCDDANVPVPPPFTPPPACPQFQTEITTTGDVDFTVDVVQLDDEPCVFKFIYDLNVGGGGGVTDLCATATIQCFTGDCNVFLDVVRIQLNPQCQGQGQFQQQFQSQCQEQQQCQIQFRFQFQVPQGQRGPQGPQGPAGKFAIVKIDEGGQDNYLGLFCTEMPEAVFMDVVDLRLQAYQTAAQMDPRFEKVCEKGSFRVISVVTPEPIVLGAKIVDSMVVVKAQEYQQCGEATVLVKGTRKGFADRRFPAFTREQMEQNEGFWAASFDQ